MNRGLATREATCLGPIGLMETRGNGYVVSDTRPWRQSVLLSTMVD